MSSVHETSRRLRVLLAHLTKHPELSDVISAGTSFGTELDVSIDSESVGAFLAWCATLEHPWVQVCGKGAEGTVMLWCRGLLGGDRVKVSAHITDLPDVDERTEPLPLAGFRHVLDRAGWWA